MKTLTILLAHGSSDPNWSDTFVNLTAKACTNAHTHLGFMELSEPSMETLAEQGVKQGCTHLRVLPLFLAKGRHLKVDIPKQLAALETRFGISTELLPPIGEHPQLAAALDSIIKETLEAE